MSIHSIRSKQLLLISLLLIAGFSIVFFYNDINNSEDFRTINEEKISNKALMYINDIDSYYFIMRENGYATAEIGELLYREYSDKPDTIEVRLEAYLVNRIKRNPTIYGSGIWYEPSLFTDSRRIGPYAYWDKGDVLITREFTDHDFTEDAWYRTGIPENWDLSIRRSNDQYITPPYDYGDGHIYITIDTIMYSLDNSIIGLTSTDWTLDFLPVLFDDFFITENTEVFLLDPETHKILYSSDRDEIFQSYTDKEWFSFFSKMNAGKNIGISRFTNEDSHDLAAYFGRTDPGFVLLFLVPDREAYINLYNLRILNISSFIVALLFTITIFYFFSERIIFRPLNLLRQATKDLRSHSFDTRSPVQESRDEIGQLAKDFNYMADQLKHSFDDLKDLNQSLEAKVADRTVYLKEVIEDLETTRDKLILYERIAATANMIAGLAHQINTPIGVAITASSYLHSRFQADPDYKMDRDMDNAFSLVTGNLKKAADLINAFKKLSVEQFIEEKRMFNLKDLITNTLNTMKRELAENRIKVSLHCSDDLEIYTFAGVMSQIVINLTDNAIRHGFRESDGRVIGIDCEVKEETFYLHFSDNGNGIEKEIQERIYDPFYSTGKGLGLGLSIIHNLVSQKLHGNIYCSSIPGSGATFVITIPMDVLC